MNVPKDTASLALVYKTNLMQNYQLTARVAATADDIARVFALRAAVFMTEQYCPYDEEFDGNDYSAPTDQAHQPCVVRGFVDRVEIEVNHQPVAVHRRCYGQGEFVLDPLHYLKLLERKPVLPRQSKTYPDCRMKSPGNKLHTQPFTLITHA